MDTRVWNNLTLTKTEDGYLVTACDEGAIEVEIPASLDGCPVCGIGADAFAGCRTLARVAFPAASLSDVAFTVGDGAFAECASLTEIEIPAYVWEVGWGAFRDCKSLVRATFSPDTYFASYAFARCSALCEISPLSMTSEGVFSDCALTRVSFAPDLDRIEESAFEGCERLEEVTFPAGLVHIGALAFRGCAALKRATFENPTGWYEYNSYKECGSPLNLTDPERNATWLREMDFDDGTLNWYRNVCQA